MKKIVLAFCISLVFVPFSFAHALVTGDISTDITGRVNYRFSDGTSGYSYVDGTGSTQYRFNDGSYGSAYTDITGNTHYYFNNSQQEKYTDGVCTFPSGFTCIQESQYQEMYNNALQGLPSCTQGSGEVGSFSVPAEACTPEGREKLIMSGTYGSWLKICKDHIQQYKTAKEVYDSCIEREDAKWEQLAQMRLDLLKRQLDIEKQKLQINKPVTKIVCPINSTLSTNPNNITTCKCNEGYSYDTSSQSCITNAEWLKKEQKPNTPFQVLIEEQRKKLLEEQRKQESIKEIKKVESKAEVIKNKVVLPVEQPKPRESIMVDSTSTARVPDDPLPSSLLESNNQDINPIAATTSTISEPVSVGKFQRVGQLLDGATKSVSHFFKRVFTKIKFW